MRGRKGLQEPSQAGLWKPDEGCYFLYLLRGKNSGRVALPFESSTVLKLECPGSMGVGFQSGVFAGVQTKDDGVEKSKSSLGSNSRGRLDCRRRVKEVGGITSRFYCYYNQETKLGQYTEHTYAHTQRNRKSFLLLENGHPSIIIFVRRIETQRIPNFKESEGVLHTVQQIFS